MTNGRVFNDRQHCLPEFPNMKSLHVLTGMFRKWLAAVPAAGCIAFLWAGVAHGITPYLYLEGAVPFYIERPEVRVLFSAEQENETRTGPFINSEKDTTTTRQKFDIRTRGWAYHPALVIFNAGLKPEFKQQTEESDTGYMQEDDSVFLGYFIDTTWLKNKPYTINLFTSMDRSDTSSSLAADTTTESSVNRGRLLLKYPVLPTTITAESKESTTESFFRTVDAEDSLRVESKKDTKGGKTELDIEIKEQNREINQVAYTTDVFRTDIRNTYRPGSKSHLISGFGYSDISTVQRETTISRLYSRLRVNHRKNLHTDYGARYEQRDELNFSSDTTTLSAGLSHLLYENLTTTLNGSTTRSKLNNGELNTDIASVDFRYRRRIPWAACYEPGCPGEDRG